MHYTVALSSLFALTLTGHTLAQAPSYNPSVGGGCAGSVGVPLLEANGGALPLVAETFRAKLSNLPVGGLSVGIIGLSQTAWGGFALPLDLSFLGMPGCTLYTDFRRTTTLTTVGGQANWDIVLPNGPEWIGRSFFQQVIVVDASVPGLGVVMSNAAEGVIGVPGSFGLEQRFGVGDGPNSAALGDVDGDGRLDVVVVNSGTYIIGHTDISLLLGDGIGGFGAEQRFIAGSSPRSVALADIDSDGLCDAVIANHGPRVPSVHLGPGDPITEISLLLADGVGSFEAQQRFEVGNRVTGGAPIAVALGDLDGDGLLDVVVVHRQDLGEMSVLLGDGAGGFGLEDRFIIGALPTAVALGDVDGDGHVDAVVVLADDISWLRGDGAGGFGIEHRFGVGASPRSIALGDVDSDGYVDAVVANAGSGDISVLRGNGAGGFGVQQCFGVGDGPVSIVLGDVDGDGYVDAVVANIGSDDISWLRGDGVGGFGTEQRFGVGDGPRSVALGDLDGDGLLDAVTTNFFSDDISLLLNRR